MITGHCDEKQPGGGLQPSMPLYRVSVFIRERSTAVYVIISHTHIYSCYVHMYMYMWGELVCCKRSLTHHPQFSRMGISCVYVLCGLVRRVSFSIHVFPCISSSLQVKYDQTKRGKEPVLPTQHLHTSDLHNNSKMYDVDFTDYSSPMRII